MLDSIGKILKYPNLQTQQIYHSQFLCYLLDFIFHPTFPLHVLCKYITHMSIHSVIFWLKHMLNTYNQAQLHLVESQISLVQFTLDFTLSITKTWRFVEHCR